MYLCKRFVIIPIYLTFVNLFGFFIHHLEYLDYILCKHCTDEDSTIFDYIVGIAGVCKPTPFKVGSGSAGAIVARRLSEDKNVKVLLLEAGRNGNRLLDIPTLGVLSQKTLYDWQYKTVSQSSSCFALHKNESVWPMGKIVGGTGMLNNMIYVRGHPADFDDWFRAKEGYNYTRDILPYFEKLEDSAQGSSYINDLVFTSILPNFISAAAKTLGFKISQDATLCDKGFGPPKANIYLGRRWTPSHHLFLNNQSNLVIRTNRVVEKILFHDDFEAYAVQYNFLDKTRYAKASKGIILSAGVIGTPKILLHSGIGPKQHLDEVGIVTKLDLPVGENLQDHVTTGFDLILLNQTLGLGIEQMMHPVSVLQYFLNGTGPLTTGGCEYLAFINTKSPVSEQKDEVQPDLQFMVIPMGINEDNGAYLKYLMGITDHTWNKYFGLLETTTMTILPILVHPKSRGTVRLANKNFSSKPVIDPKYLTEHEDVEVLVRGINLIKELIQTDPMQKLGAKLNSNVFPGCEKFDFDTESYWECYVRHLTLTSYHPVGTCKMGHEHDKSSVVNFEFQVKGTNNLFVVDGSVAPSLSSGNINGAIMMLAEMASDTIKQRNFLGSGKCRNSEIFFKHHICN